MKEQITDITEQNLAVPEEKPPRELNGDFETVNYPGGSTNRIWRNDLAVNFENHWHTAMEIILPVENSYTVNIDNISYHLNVGDILVIPPGRLHELIAPSTGERFIYLFDISILSKLAGFASLHPLLNQPLLITSVTYPKIFETEYNLLLQIRNKYFSTNNFIELTIYSLLIEFFVQLGVNHYSSDFQNPYIRLNKQSEYIEKFNAVLDYIDNHYMEDITMDSVAKSAGFSKFHFARLFKQYTNTTFYDYLSYKRIKIAQNLLSRPELSITEIAFRSGFSTLSTFNRIFKKLVKCTPTEYRLIHSKDHMKY
jgi:AraC-like DNA-binding protein